MSAKAASRSLSPAQAQVQAGTTETPTITQPEQERSIPDSSSISGKLRWAAPSIVTIGALSCGLSAVKSAAENEFDMSAIFVTAACVLDGLDGQVARALHTSSDIGFELDSLCDVANFGVTPALLLYFWAKSLPVSECYFEECRIDHKIVWFASCFYAAMCALRLARFNVAGRKEEMDKQVPSQEPPKHNLRHFGVAWAQNLSKPKLYFEGVPAPVGAAYAMFPMFLHYSNLPVTYGRVGELGAWAIGRKGTALALLGTGLLMVSPFRTLSSKMLKTHKNFTVVVSRSMLRTIAKYTGFLVFLGCAWFYVFETLLALVSLHILSIPIGMFLFRTYAAENDKSS